MTRWIAPENDTSALPAPPDRSQLRVTVVVPVYNRVGLLERTVAALAVQDHPAHLTQVVVADDGSTEDVAAALAPWRDRLDLTVVRRDHEGYGAGQARNLGARTGDGDVVLFVDADCLPARGLVRRHACWHELADNLVVVGARHDLDTTAMTAAGLASGEVVVADGDGTPPSDWRALFYRRTSRLRSGDEAYRALVSNNVSVRRDQFLAVGGFNERFRRWGGEDTELGWRLQRAGLFLVADDHAVVHHQVQEDGEEGWRQRQRARNDGVVRTHIPHRFYRRPDPTVVHAVPKVSWVVLPTWPDVVEQLWEELAEHAHRDHELVLHDPHDRLAAFADLHVADPRVTVVTDPDPLAVLAAARGEVLLLLHGAATPDRYCSARVVRRLDARPRTSILTCAVTEGIGADARTWRHPIDVAGLAAVVGTPWPPMTAVRGREVAKVLPTVDDPAGLWSALRPICDVAHLDAPLVTIPDRGALADGAAPRPRVTRAASRRRVVGDALAGDEAPRTAVRAVASGVRDVVARLDPRGDDGHPVAGADGAADDDLGRGPAGTPAAAGSGPAGTGDDDGGLVEVRYVGWTGHDNVGDEAMLAAARRLLPWAELTTSGDPGRLLVLGGGTLVNRGYLRVLREKDSPRSERVVLGTGVASVGFWGHREPPDQWVRWLDSCGYVGVRGPDSLRRLRDLGFAGEVEQCGDLALALEPPDDVERVTGRLVVSPLHTGGRCHGGDDRAVLDALGDLVGHAVAEGRQVHLLACHPADDRWCFEAMRRAGHPDLPYLAAYDDLDATLALLASADAVVAERLHAGVLAAVTGTPFVPVEYRPKTRDFARSVGADDLLVRTDEVTGQVLVDRLARLERTRAERTQRVTHAVRAHRSRLHAAAATIRGLVT